LNQESLFVLGTQFPAFLSPPQFPVDGDVQERQHDQACAHDPQQNLERRIHTFPIREILFQHRNSPVSRRFAGTFLPECCVSSSLKVEI